MASIRPIFLALGWSLAGSLFDAIEIKMMLSIPSTISRNVSVNRLIQTSALAKSGITNSEIILGCFYQFAILRYFMCLFFLRIEFMNKEIERIINKN